MPVWLLVVLICLATYRVTRLIIEDTFPPVGVPRDHLINWWDPDDDWLRSHPHARSHWGALGRSLRYLFTCPWCMGMWVGAGVVYATTLMYSVPAPVLVWLAASAVTGVIAKVDEE